MPITPDATLQALRMKYKAVYTAHRSCVRALHEAEMSGEPAPPGLVEKESQALRDLTKARAALLVAMDESAAEERRS